MILVIEEVIGYKFNLLEQIHEYGMLVNLWHDICGNLSSFTTTGNLVGAYMQRPRIAGAEEPANAVGPA